MSSSINRAQKPKSSFGKVLRDSFRFRGRKGRRHEKQQDTRKRSKSVGAENSEISEAISEAIGTDPVTFSGFSRDESKEGTSGDLGPKPIPRANTLTASSGIKPETALSNRRRSKDDHDLPNVVVTDSEGGEFHGLRKKFVRLFGSLHYKRPRPSSTSSADAKPAP